MAGEYLESRMNTWKVGWLHGKSGAYLESGKDTWKVRGLA